MFVFQFLTKQEIALSRSYLFILVSVTLAV